MIKKSKTRRAVKLGVTALSLGGSALLAAPAHAAAGPNCEGEICAYWASPVNGTITVHAWAYRSNFSFYGHYELSWPGGHSNTSPEQIWNHTENAYWRNFKVVNGNWCVTGWRDDGGGHYTSMGVSCADVS